MPFIEALRQLKLRVGPECFCTLFVSLVPILSAVGEAKTKPTQHGAKELRACGLDADLIMCRSEVALEEGVRTKLAMFCNVSALQVISVPDCGHLYKIPMLLQEQGVSGKHLLAVDEVMSSTLLLHYYFMHRINLPQAWPDTQCDARHGHTRQVA